jgi:myo-inositol 2-dehydrogenase / D-chiro-inositol 1-dehydrogenase
MVENSNRRNFVKHAGLAAAGAMIMKPELVRGADANSALSLGLIGCGNRGMYVSGIFAKNEYLKVAAICDIYEDRIKAGQEKYSGAKVYKDYKELLASDVDAVLIATPAYLHPEMFEAAVDAKKHIYMEKPAAVDPQGCLRVKAAALRADPTKRITVDYQQRYGKDYRDAYHYVKSGAIGDIKGVRASWFGGGPAIKYGHPAAEERIRNWFFYRELSGDILVEQDCHNIDVVNWFVGANPVKVNGYGGQAIRHYGDIYDNLSCSFEYANGLIFSYAANQFRTDGYADVSETFICEHGAVNTSRKGITYYHAGQTEPKRVVTKGDITADAVNEFVEGARTGMIENFGVAAAESTLTAVMALYACVHNREFTWEEIQKA